MKLDCTNRWAKKCLPQPITLSTCRADTCRMRHLGIFLHVQTAECCSYMMKIPVDKIYVLATYITNLNEFNFCRHVNVECRKCGRALQQSARPKRCNSSYPRDLQMNALNSEQLNTILVISASLTRTSITIYPRKSLFSQVSVYF